MQFLLAFLQQLLIDLIVFATVKIVKAQFYQHYGLEYNQRKLSFLHDFLEVHLLVDFDLLGFFQLLS